MRMHAYGRKACRAAGHQNQGEMNKLAAQKAKSIMQSLPRLEREPAASQQVFVAYEKLFA